MTTSGEVTALTDEKQLQAVEKVLRRAEISRITRNLKSRLALASFKAKRGWESLCLDSIEPRLEQMESTFQGRNGNNSNGDEISPKRDFYQAFPHSSPSRSPSGQFSQPMLKPAALLQPAPALGPDSKSIVVTSPNGKRIKVNSEDNTKDTNSASNITTTHVTDASPKSTNTNINTSISNNESNPTNLTTPPLKPTLPGELLKPSTTTTSASTILPPPPPTTRLPRISPPKTPPPKNRNNQALSSDRDGADLLMYLATSPSPAQRTSNIYGGYNQYPASSPFYRPPTGNTPHTPQQGFNFTDYLNIPTPSPAQITRTPDRPLLRSARQRLNFDHMPESTNAPPTSASRFASHLSSEDSNQMVA